MLCFGQEKAPGAPRRQGRARPGAVPMGGTERPGATTPHNKFSHWRPPSARCHGSLGLSLPEGGFSAFCCLSSHSEASSHASCPTDTRRASLYSIHVYENAFPTPVHIKLLPDPTGPLGAEGGRGAGGALRGAQLLPATKHGHTSLVSSRRGAGDSGQSPGDRPAPQPRAARALQGWLCPPGQQALG